VTEEGVDPREFLERLQGEHRTLRWAPLPPAVPGQWGDHPLAGTESLRYLQEHWTLPDGPDAPGKGVRGRLSTIVTRLVFRALGRYLHEERELLGHLVRMNDALARRCDELARTVGDRQVADAENLAQLAAWLQAEPPRPAAEVPAPAGDTQP